MLGQSALAVQIKNVVSQPLPSIPTCDDSRLVQHHNIPVLVNLSQLTCMFYAYILLVTYLLLVLQAHDLVPTTMQPSDPWPNY